ncbi:BID domain-containing T4SS effector [Bartonella sp. B39]
MKKKQIGYSASLTQEELQKYYRRLDPETRKILRTEARNFFYPKSTVYKNKYHITNKKDFFDVCARDVGEIVEILRTVPLPKKIDSSYLKNLHKQIFSKTFEWAGHTRDEHFKFADGSIASLPFLKNKNFAKPFATGREIQRGLKQLDQMLLETDDLRNLTREEFIEHASQVISHLYSLNPFREGNRHVIRLFAEKLGQAAGYDLDFSLMTKKRQEFVRAEAVNNSNAAPLKHLLEDISDPDRLLILREFINNMKQLGLDENNYRLTVAAQDGHIYHGTYRGSGDNGFMMDVNGTFVVGHKEHLPPEQVKTLKIGDSLTFTAPLPQEAKKVLIPKENVPPLTNEELSQRVYDSALVKNSLKNIQTLCKVVYGKKHALRNRLPQFKIPITNADLEQGEKLARLIETSPQSVHKLRGVGVFGLKSSARQHAEANFAPLSHTILGYVYALKQAENDILAARSAEQERCAKSVEAPSKKLNNLFSMTKEEQQQILSSSPELRVEVQIYFLKLNERLSPNEHQAIENRHYAKLAEIMGTSISQAREIAATVRGIKEANDFIQQQHREMSKEKERHVRQSVTSSGSEKSVEKMAPPAKAENVIKFSKQEKTVEEQGRQRRAKSMTM